MTINSPAKKLSVQNPASAKYVLVANNKLSGRVNDEILLLTHYVDDFLANLISFVAMRIT